MSNKGILIFECLNQGRYSRAYITRSYTLLHFSIVHKRTSYTPSNLNIFIFESLSRYMYSESYVALVQSHIQWTGRHPYTPSRYMLPSYFWRMSICMAAYS